MNGNSLEAKHNMHGCGTQEEENHGHNKINNLWKVKTKLCGYKNISISTKRAHLSPSEQWTIFENVAIPKRGYMPKLQMSTVCAWNRVLIEKQHREYIKHHISTLLETEYGITPTDMKPPPSSELDIDSVFLNLVIFDDEEFDCRTPSDWLSLGEVDGIRHPVPATGFLESSPRGYVALSEDVTKNK